MSAGRQGQEVKGRGKDAVGGVEGEAGEGEEDGAVTAATKKFTSGELNPWSWKWKKYVTTALANTPHQLTLYPQLSSISRNLAIADKLKKIASRVVR